jgi:hypothetical protein
VSQRDGLCPLCEIISGSKYILMLFLGTRCNLSYDIQPPLIKRPRDSHWLEWDYYSLLSPNAYLTSFIVPSIGVSIFEQGGPIIASSQCLIVELQIYHMNQHLIVNPGR